ncbi:MAG: SCO family protein [Myxococcota bacterium]
MVTFAWMWLGCSTPTTNPEPLPYYASRDFTPHWFTPDTVPEGFHAIPAFSLTDQHGATVTDADLDGNVSIVSFFFTRCGGICPSLTASLHGVATEFAGRDDVQLLGHSVMPTDDTVPVLKAFADKHGITSPQWHLLTGPRPEIYALGREAYFVEEDLGEPVDPDAFLHTENVVMVDGTRRIRGIYNGLNASAMRQLVADVKTVLAE